MLVIMKEGTADQSFFSNYVTFFHSNYERPNCVELKEILIDFRFSVK